MTTTNASPKSNIGVSKRKKAGAALSPKPDLPTRKKRQSLRATQCSLAPQTNGHVPRVTHTASADHRARETQGEHVVTIRQAAARRWFCIRTRRAVVNQCYAWARRIMGVQPDDKTSDLCRTSKAVVDAIIDEKPLPDVQPGVALAITGQVAEWAGSIRGVNRQTADMEKIMVAAAKQLPVWPWVESVRGFGALGLALIVSEAGDLSDYDNPAKLWKRMGVAVLDGTAQGKLPASASAEQWIEHGYSRRRRSVLYTIGDSMIKTGDTYRQVYLDRKEYELPRVQDSKAPKLHAHRRAQRYMEKKMLRDLWCVWTGNDLAGAVR